MMQTKIEAPFLSSHPKDITTDLTSLELTNLLKDYENCSFQGQPNEKNYIMFKSLACKKILYRRDSQAIRIEFPDDQLFQKYLRNYNILSRHVKVPEIIHVQQKTMTLFHRFIKSSPHELTPDSLAEVVDLMKTLTSINSQQYDLPFLVNQKFMEMIRVNTGYWNNFATATKIDNQSVDFLMEMLGSFAFYIDNLPHTTIYRDLNLTNLLRCQQTNELYFIDFDHLCSGPYIIDLCFILTDKYFYVDDLTISTVVQKFCKAFRRDRQSVWKDFSIGCAFLNYQWLIQMVSIYYKRGLGFHLDLRALLIQVLRSTQRVKPYIKVQEYQRLKQIAENLVKGFVEGYKKLYLELNLQPLPQKIVFINNSHISQGKSKQNQLSTLKNLIKIEQIQSACRSESCSTNDRICNQNFIFLQLLDKIFKNNEESVHIVYSSKHHMKHFESLKKILPSEMLLIQPRQYHQQQISIFLQNQSSTTTNKMHNSMQNYSAIILAAGQGSRLGYRHKALVTIHNITLLQHWIHKLHNVGVGEVVIAELASRVHETKAVVDRLQLEPEMGVKYVEFEQPVGPGRTLQACLESVTRGKVFVISCDVYSNVEIKMLCFESESTVGVMALEQSQENGFFTYAEQNGNSFVQQNLNKASKAYSFAGICCFTKQKILEAIGGTHLEPSQCPEFRQILSRNIRQYKVLPLLIGNSVFFIYNINTPEDIVKAQKQSIQL